MDSTLLSEILNTTSELLPLNITNPFDEVCHLIEIQYGEACIEDDIERADYYKS